jgi:hypothetical protein
MVLSAIANYEEIGLKSLLIATIIAMGGIIRYLYTSKETALKEKDDRIRSNFSHQNDLKTLIMT